MRAVQRVRHGRSPHTTEAPVSLNAAKRGQSLIEACVATGVICLVFFGLFQLSQLAAAKEVINHAAARGARAKSVGLSSFMVSKAIRVAAIPNAGRMREPGIPDQNGALLNMVQTLSPGELWEAVLGGAPPPTTLQDLENARIPEYMGAESWRQADYILDYEDWDSIDPSFPLIVPDGAIIDVTVSQDYPLRIPLHRAFYAPEPNSDGVDTILLRGVSRIECHYPLYLVDSGWE